MSDLSLPPTLWEIFTYSNSSFDMIINYLGLFMTCVPLIGILSVLKVAWTTKLFWIPFTFSVICLQVQSLLHFLKLPL
jgi:hypothetical protein